jgi:hypothetical protein
MSKQEKTVRSVAWTFASGETSRYEALLSDGDAKLFAGILEDFVDTNYIRAFEIVEVEAPVSKSTLFKIMSEEFPLRPRDWLPKGKE